MPSDVVARNVLRVAADISSRNGGHSAAAATATAALTMDVDAETVAGAAHALAAAGEVTKAHNVAHGFVVIARHEFESALNHPNDSLAPRRIAYAEGLAQCATLAVCTVARAMFLSIGRD